MILGKCETVKRAKAWMKRYQVKQSTGFVIFFSGNPCEWSLDLPEPHRNRPGCIAVNLLTGDRYEACGGTYDAGHDGWQPIASDHAAIDELIAAAGAPPLSATTKTLTFMPKATITTRLESRLKAEPYAKDNLLLQDALKEIVRLQKLLAKHAPTLLDAGDGGGMDPPEDPPITPNPPQGGIPGEPPANPGET